MKCLYDLLERDEFKDIISRCRKSTTVQGVGLSLDQRWLHAWQIGERANPDNPQKGF